MRSRGFTLLELIVAMAVVMVVVSLSATYFSYSMADSRSAQATQIVVQTLRAARSRAMELSSNVTVTIDGSAVTAQVQNGAASTVRTELPTGVAISGTNTFVFNPTGIASTAGAVNIASSASNRVESRVVTVSALGQIIR